LPIRALLVLTCTGVSFLAATMAKRANARVAMDQKMRVNNGFAVHRGTEG
jgi:hypothetical protein